MARTGQGSWAAAFVCVALLAGGPGAEGSVFDALVGHWDFEDGGNLGADVSPNGNNGTVNGGVTASAGRIGSGAATFDGVNGYLSVADSGSLDSAAGAGLDRTVAFWFNTTTSANRVVMEKGSNQHFVVQTDSVPTPGLISWRVGSGSGDRVLSTGTVNDGAWHHYAGTYEGTGQLATLYIDGVLQNTTTHASPAANNDPFVIGARNGGAYAYPGQMDDVAIWNVELSDDQVAALAHEVTTPTNAALRIPGVTYAYTGSIQPHTAPTRSDPGNVKLTDGVLGTTAFDDGTWVAFRDPLGFQNDNGQPQPQVDFDLGGVFMLGLLQVDYLVSHTPSLFEPDSVDIEYYGDPGFTTLLGSATATGFVDVDGKQRFEVALGLVEAQYVRLQFYNDQEWTWLGEITFFQAIPEPTSLSLLGLGGLALLRRRRRSRH
ncbi:MAG: LamG domain-containing protein [Planctomycetes bacterium]|nr:LamG domain-containing protein [Planctomycetota bacterium]